MRRIALLFLGLCLTIGAFSTVGCKKEEATTVPTTTDTTAGEGDKDADGDANKTDADETDPAVK